MKRRENRKQAATQVTRVAIAGALRSAESDFSHCWAILVKIRTGLFTAADAKDLFDFQPILISACARLNRLYDSTRAEQRALVARKSQLPREFFLRRMRVLGRYADALRFGLKIGRDIGDVFAWFWYQNDRELLASHLKNEEVKSFPGGIGGAGEISLVKTYQGLNKKFILYHGITSILRAGDISLVDPDGPRVDSIAELKTSKSSDDELRVSIVGYRPGKRPRNGERRLPLNVGTPEPQRLERQLDRIEQAFVPLIADAKCAAKADLYMEALKRLARRFRRSRSGAWEKAAEGLLIFIVPNKTHRTLATRLLDRRPFNTKSVKVPPPSIANELLLEGSTDNVFLLDPLELAGDATWVPAFWLGVDEDLLWRVLTGRASIWAVYNPAFFLQKLRAKGFKVEQRSDGQYSLIYRSGEATMRTDDIRQPLASIRRRLLREESVIEILLEPARLLASGNIPQYDELRVHLFQFQGSQDEVPRERGGHLGESSGL